MTAVGDVKYHQTISTKYSVKQQTPRGDMKDGTPTFREYVAGANHIAYTKDEKTSIGDVVITQQSRKEDNDRQTPNEDFRILKRDRETRPTCKSDNIVISVVG